MPVAAGVLPRPSVFNDTMLRLHGGGGHGQAAEQGDIVAFPEPVGGAVGHGKWCQGPEDSYAPAAFDAFDKVAGVFFKTQGKHNGNNAQLGEVIDKVGQLHRQNAQINHG